MSTNREIISLHIGQAGIQTGSAIWEQYCKEHQVDPESGTSVRVRMRRARTRVVLVQTDNPDERYAPDEENYPPEEKLQDPKAASFGTFFEETTAGFYVPRAILTDLEPNVVDSLMNSELGGLFNPDMCINGKEDGANNYARGRYTIGSATADRVYEAIRKQLEISDNVQGFIINNGVGGGSGSGFGGLLQDHLKQERPKTPIIGFNIYPSPQLSTSIVEPYNALLSTNDQIETANITCVLDNEGIYGLCRRHLNINKPDYLHINRIIAKVISSITCGMRFPGDSQQSISSFQTNLVPFPRIHFMTSSISPLISETGQGFDALSESQITHAVVDPSHMLIKFRDWDPEEDQYMGVNLQFRGNVLPTQVNQAVQEIKGTKVKLVEWCPTGFKTAIIERAPGILSDDGMAPTDRSVVMIANNVAIARPFRNRICRKYDLLYSQRSYVHWYVGEGMEEGEFAEARENLEMLLSDFLDVLKGENTDEIMPDEEY